MPDSRRFQIHGFTCIIKETFNHDPARAKIGIDLWARAIARLVLRGNALDEQESRLGAPDPPPDVPRES